MQLQAIFGRSDLVSDPRDCRTRGVLGRMSDLWQRRRERVQLRQAIRSLCELDDHLLRDIGMNRLVLSYGFAGSSQTVAGTQPRERARRGGMIAFAPFPRRN